MSTTDVKDSMEPVSITIRGRRGTPNINITNPLRIKPAPAIKTLNRKKKNLKIKIVVKNRKRPTTKTVNI